MKFKLHKEQDIVENVNGIIKLKVVFEEGEVVEARNPHNKPLSMALRKNVSGVLGVPVHPMFRVRIPLGVSILEAEGYVAKIYAEPDFSFAYGLSQPVGPKIVQLGAESDELSIDLINSSDLTVNLTNDTVVVYLVIEKICSNTAE